MSEKKILVPPGMLKAFWDVIPDQCVGDTGPSETEMDLALEAALRWLSENPIEPNLFEARELRSACAGEAGTQEVQSLVSSWQRRMFLAPDPEVPEEIKGFLWTETQNVPPILELAEANVREHNRQIIEAYRRGQRSVK